MKKLSWLVAILAISFLFFRCQKELHFTGGPDTGIPATPDPITTSVQGNVTDENNQPAAGVVVTAGAGTTITDANGYFRFTNATLDKNTSLVTVTKDGYFKGYRVFAATKGCNQVNLKLIKKDLAGTVAAASGGEVSLASGAKVKLPAGGVVTASSNGNYTGDVKVYASYIDPRSPDISKTIPGSLTGNDKDGKRVALSSYGMIAVELSSTSGDKLQIKSGSVATLTIPIPSAGDISAPATIPLWYIDETTGIWQEEGTATKQGNNYVGDVKHFSFWNSDYPNDGVNLSLTLQTPSGSPLIYSQVRLSMLSTSDTGSSYLSSRYDYTDSLGQVSGLVPANTELTLEVLGTCGSVVYSQTLQPLTGDKNLGVIKITDDTHSLISFTGLIEGCNSSPVTNGYALINFGGIVQYAHTDANGRFATTYISCSSPSATATAIGINNDDQQQSNLYTLNVNSTSIDAGTLSACGNSVEQYINFIIDDTSNYSVTGADSSVYGYDNDSTGTFIGGGSYTLANESYFTAQGRATGTFPMTSLHLYATNWKLKASSTVTFTKFPTSVGEFYEGSVKADYLDYSSTDTTATHSLTGTFRARRNF